MEAQANSEPVRRSFISRDFWNVPDNMIPFVYLIAVGALAVVLEYFKVPPQTSGLIIGAGITRVKISQNNPPPPPPTYPPLK